MCSNAYFGVFRGGGHFWRVTLVCHTEMSMFDLNQRYNRRYNRPVVPPIVDQTWTFQYIIPTGNTISVVMNRLVAMGLYFIPTFFEYLKHYTT